MKLVFKLTTKKKKLENALLFLSFNLLVPLWVNSSVYTQKESILYILRLNCAQAQVYANLRK